MAADADLIERTQHCLRYKVTDDGGDTAAPVTGFIAHDELLAAAVPNSPLHKLLQTPVTSQAEAAALLNGEGLIDDTDLVTPRGRISVDALGYSLGTFAAYPDANESDEVFLAWEAPNFAAAAVITIRYVHSVDS
jgi:hypothetical protein